MGHVGPRPWAVAEGEGKARPSHRFQHCTSPPPVSLSFPPLPPSLLHVGPTHRAFPYTHRFQHKTRAPHARTNALTRTRPQQFTLNSPGEGRVRVGGGHGVGPFAYEFKLAVGRGVRGDVTVGLLTSLEWLNLRCGVQRQGGKGGVE
jgi:hypothetical protein